MPCSVGWITVGLSDLSVQASFGNGNGNGNGNG